ncbi:hypothetical protein FRB94_006406 [Tulasnella sp. JGI-2019a]|nr:hypothetical protein FRB94_006406 [Tulasnella sp. JGI-2019a]
MSIPSPRLLTLAYESSELGATAEVDAAAINDRDSQLLLAPDLNQRQKRYLDIRNQKKEQ